MIQVNKGIDLHGRSPICNVMMQKWRKLIKFSWYIIAFCMCLQVHITNISFKVTGKLRISIYEYKYTRDAKISGIQYSSTRNRYSRVLEYSEDTPTFWRNLWPKTMTIIIPLIICWKTKLIPNYVWSDYTDLMIK